MGKKRNFKTRLDPFADLLYKLHEDVREILRTKTDGELRQLIKDANQCTTTNCGWATYNIREIVIREAQFILQSRPKEDDPHETTEV